MAGKGKDRAARAKIRVQIDRLSLGNFGKCRFLKGGLAELKINWGPAIESISVEPVLPS